MILSVQQYWGCPNCPATAVTEGQPNRFHCCSGLRGLTAPMIRDGVRCKVVAELREDYVGREDVQFDSSGRPVMAVRTVRDDGEDLAVLAPAAHGFYGG